MQDDDNEQEDEVNSGLGVAERELLLSGLRAEPDAPPPRAVWERIAAQAEAEGLFRGRPRIARHRYWYAGAGLAASLLLAVWWLPALTPGAVDNDDFPTEPAYVDNSGASTLATLMVKSQVLESDLRALPSKPSMMRAGTAATISDLEDRIAAIDHVLNDTTAGLGDDQKEIYWRERVRLMESLVHLRYAQMRRSSM